MFVPADLPGEEHVVAVDDRLAVVHSRRVDRSVRLDRVHTKTAIAGHIYTATGIATGSGRILQRKDALMEFYE